MGYGGAPFIGYSTSPTIPDFGPTGYYPPGTTGDIYGGAPNVLSGLPSGSSGQSSSTWATVLSALAGVYGVYLQGQAGKSIARIQAEEAARERARAADLNRSGLVNTFPLAGATSPSISSQTPAGGNLLSSIGPLPLLAGAAVLVLVLARKR